MALRLQIYTALRDRIVAAHPRDRQAHLSACLDKLMADVQRNLESKNRDKFTQVWHTRLLASPLAVVLAAAAWCTSPAL